jgi:glutathione synthase/RimK-type ligase-like ATP-grasp enzyme
MVKNVKRNTMKKIFALTDYKNKFGSKHFDIPYRSGFDKTLLKKYLTEYDYTIEFIGLSDIYNRKIAADTPILYTSSEDDGYHYKSYIEDIVFGLELKGFPVIPGYKYLRANNNKVFMYILYELFQLDPGIKTFTFGVVQELKEYIDRLSFPAIIKTAEGASGRGVFLAENPKKLIETAKKIGRTPNFKYEFRDFLRGIRHKNYIRESKHRKKFIVQNFIPNLTNDWKIYIFGDKLYIFYRPILKGRGIKASGGGYDNYYYGEQANPPEGIFDFALKVFNKLDIPHISMDIAFDGKQFYLLEFQALYFGTAGIPYSEGYYTLHNSNWVFIKNKLDIEKVYIDSIVQYLKKYES